MSENKTIVHTHGVGFFGLLTITLIVLKLTGHVTLSWWYIAAIPFTPIFIFLFIMISSACIIGIACLLSLIVSGFYFIVKYIKGKK